MVAALKRKEEAKVEEASAKGSTGDTTASEGAHTDHVHGHSEGHDHNHTTASPVQGHADVNKAFVAPFSHTQPDEEPSLWQLKVKLFMQLVKRKINCAP